MFIFSIISVIGSDENERSMINRCKQCLQVAIENTPDILSASESRMFYISWLGKISLAKTIELINFIFIEYLDTIFLLLSLLVLRL